MPSRFNSRTMSLGDLLSHPHELRVPDYQRPFSWTTLEAAQLLDDLTSAINEQTGNESEDEAYFLGSVLLIDSTRKSDSAPNPEPAKPLDIVDGQQRLVTATILLSVIRDIADDRGLALAREIEPHIWARRSRAIVPRLVPRYSEAGFIRAYVQEPRASANMPDAEELPANEERLLDVREHLAEELVDYTDEALIGLTRYLLDFCFMSVITTNTIDRAHRIFTVLNNRGRPLTRNDILKAQILGAIPADRRPDYTTTWDRIEQRLGARFESLFSHIRTTEGHGRNRVIDSVSEVVAASGTAERFFDEVLSPCADIYATILDCGRSAFPSHPEIQQYLTYLAWLGSEDWVPPLMTFWRDCRGEPTALEAMLRRLDRLAYGLRLLGYGTDKRQTRLNAVLTAVREGRALDEGEPAFGLSKEDLRNIHFNLRSLYPRNQMTCKLVLLRVNEQLSGPIAGIEPGDFTVEHVLPQKPGRTSEWRTWFPSADEREECTQSLGNLILISRAANERAKNMNFGRKLEIYFPAEGPDPLALTKELSGRTQWNATAVRERQTRFLAVLEEMWSLSQPAPDGDGEVPKNSRRTRRRRPAAAVEPGGP